MLRNKLRWIAECNIDADALVQDIFGEIGHLLLLPL